VQAVRSDRGIIDSLVEADGRLGLVRSTGRPGPHGHRPGGNLSGTTIRARRLGRVVVTGQIDEGDDGQEDVIRAREGSVFVADSDDRALVRDERDFGGVRAFVG
jgi:hypothetical protein